MSLPTDLAGWLDYIERLHPATIDLGLERVQRVQAVLDIPKFCPLFIVGGTNGKGSTCTMLEAILHAGGYRVGKYLSPHLVRYNERVQIDGAEAGDADLIAGFEAVEAARGDVQLTYFEYTTLAAWVTFSRAGLDALVLEVGLGGRLDAVNVFDPDCSIITSVDVDHVDYLGDSREQIGWEKAHIYRPGRPAICSDPQPPQRLVEHAQAIGADLRLIGRDFGYEGDRSQWLYWGEKGRRSGLPYPALRGANQLLNAAACLAALEAMHERLPVSAQHIRTGLLAAQLPGRFQVLPGRPTRIFDVAHNPHAAAVLRENLIAMPGYRRTIAVVGMLKDKDIGGVFAHLKDRVDVWYVATLDNPRGATAAELEEAIRQAGAEGPIEQCATPHEAYARAQEAATESDRILVFGSFYTVADVMAMPESPAPAAR
ncbi:MAG TPA: bifunctional tetrahydrofolate synthase/dihydrofolate synthase [Burkholderiales bacterium]|nr:bifunctional tetrahydrofolate synthase/dihydrofolate synthase [Burkholderiales bacterium]